MPPKCLVCDTNLRPVDPRPAFGPKLYCPKCERPTPQHRGLDRAKN